MFEILIWILNIHVDCILGMITIWFVDIIIELCGGNIEFINYFKVNTLFFSLKEAVYFIFLKLITNHTYRLINNSKDAIFKSTITIEQSLKSTK